MSEREQFAKRLRALREAAGLTQEGLAEKAGLTRDGVAHLEQARRSPSWETVLALAGALGVECSAFTGGQAEQAEVPPGKKPSARKSSGGRRKT